MQTNDSTRTKALFQLRVYYFESNIDSALYYWKEHTELLRKQGHIFFLGHQHIIKAIFYRNKGMYDQAFESHLTAQSILNDESIPVDPISKSYYPDKTNTEVKQIIQFKNKQHLGYLFAQIGNIENGILDIEDGVAGLRKLNADSELFYALINLSRAYLLSGNLNIALSSIEEAIKLRKDKPPNRWLGSALYIKGSILHGQQRYQESLVTFQSAVDTCIALSNYSIAAKSQIGLAQLSLTNQNLDDALDQAFKAINYIKEYGVRDETPSAYRIIAASSFEKQKYKQAYRYLLLANSLENGLQKD